MSKFTLLGTGACQGIPASGQYAPVLPNPHTAETASQTTVVADDGQILDFPRINQIASANARRASIIRFSGTGLLMQTAVIQSCGDTALDQQAANLLKAAGIAPGVYTINWRGGEK